MAKSIQQFLQETTVPEHLHYIPDNWDHHGEVSKDTMEKMDAAFNKKSFTHFPLDVDSVADADSDVVEHLTNHGYSIKDYAKGIATIKKHVGDPSRGIPMREKHVEEKIGSVLEKTGASDLVKKAFVNDPARQSSKGSSEHHVVISTTPLAIAGMSTGTNWKNQSCMNMEGGCNKHYLEDDSKHGTHVAFLVHKNDETAFKFGEPSNPIARIALKPYHENETDSPEPDTIFRPENRTYGASNTHFVRAVAQWANENYPAKEDVEYTKNSDVYDDTGNDTYRAYGKKHVEDAIDNHANLVDSSGDIMDHHVIDHAINYAHEKFGGSEGDKDGRLGTARRIWRIGNLNTQHVSKVFNMVKDSPSHIRELAMHHGDKFSSNQITELQKTHALPNKVLMNPKLPESVVDSLAPNEYNFVRKSLLKPRHYDRVIDSYLKNESGSAYPMRDLQKGFNEQHLNRISEGFKDDPSRDSAIPILVNHDNFTQKHHDDIVAGIKKNIYFPEYHVRDFLRSSKYAKYDDVEKMGQDYKGKTINPYEYLAGNDNVSSDDAKKLADKYVDDSIKASNPHSNAYRGEIPTKVADQFTDDHLDKLAGAGKAVRFEDAKNSNRYLDKILSHVQKHDNILSEHLSNQMDTDPDYDEDEDEKAQELRENMHNALETYSRAMDNHIDWHIHTKNDNNDDVIKDWNEHEKMEKRLSSLSGLDNYMTPANSSRYDDTNHYDDWFSEHDDRLHELKKSTEEAEERFWD